MTKRQPDSTQDRPVTSWKKRVVGLLLLGHSGTWVFLGMSDLLNSAQGLRAAESDLGRGPWMLLVALLGTFAIYFLPITFYVAGWVAEAQQEKAARVLLGLAALFVSVLFCGGLGATILVHLVGPGDLGRLSVLQWGADSVTAILAFLIAGASLGMALRGTTVFQSVRLFRRESKTARDENGP